VKKLSNQKLRFMKKLNFLLLLVLLLSVNIIRAAETEPNNTKANANVLALNGNSTGAINTAGDEDWYKITTNADGMLNVTITVSNGLTLRCYIYDNDGTILLNSGYSSSTTTVSEDGLAAGTYYIKLIAYYSTQLPAYTVSNTLTLPAKANDVEPNDTKAQAANLPLNNKKTGHVGYYYNNKRDTADWYKVTTNSDGLLKVTATPANGETIRIYLYDNDGTTLLNSAYSSSNAILNEDGLATGTYYIKVFSYYNTEFEPYTISDSLFKPEQANDAEPNNAKAQASNLPLNGSKTGHVGYYYNHYRDTADWYKVTTDADGLLKVTAIPANGKTIRIYLYDNDGNTLFTSAYSSSKAELTRDGLAVGTYYIKVFSYYNTEFEPYTLSNSLVAYDYTKDEESNAKPYQAKTVLSTLTETGHVGFYYNNKRDSVDWLKINYTGSGNLDFTIEQEELKSGGYNTLRFQVYKDTNASAIHSSYSSAASRTVNLTSLSQGYYWLKIYPYYSSEYSSYSIKNSFTQVAKAKIGVKEFSTTASCDDNYIKVNPYNGNGPFTVQLYRFGIPYGDAASVKKGSTKKFDNLPAGSYYAVAYADGATGNAFGKSKTIIIEPVPADLTTQNITNNKATFAWAKEDCAAYYLIKYRKHGTTTWTSKQTVGNVNSFKAKNLNPNTTYEWIVATADSANHIVAKSAFTDSVVFTTAAGLIAENEMSEDDASTVNITSGNMISVAPNPATNFFIIHYKNDAKEKVVASLYDIDGKLVWTSGIINADAIDGKQVVINKFGNGMYYLKIANEKGMLKGVAKLIVNK
jgi:hypothetical protein